jgi:rhamnosyltransferase
MNATAPPPLVCALVITFRPSSSLLENLETLRCQVKEVVLIDNGSGSEFAPLLEDAARSPCVRVIRNPTNLGIAAALNQGIRYAIDAGYAWVATFDQDSTVTAGLFTAMLSDLEKFADEERVALIAPMICRSWEEYETLSKRRPRPCFFTRTAMSSGSLIRTSVFASAGFYDESFFMDYVDYDFCLRLGEQGWKIIGTNNAFLIHRLGTAQINAFLGLRFTTRTHSALRRYYIMRNRITVYRRHAFSAPLWCLHDFLWIFLELAKVILFEADRPAKLRNVLRGVVDGLRGIGGAPGSDQEPP